MMQGKLIVLEGIDGSGKSTQLRLLAGRLEREGFSFRTVTFPRYNESSSTLIRSYLGGEFGSEPGDVGAYAASTFFCVDRYASYKTDWGKYYNDGGVVLCDRYTTSNALHQGSKLSEGELEVFLDWLYDFEFRLMELPKPDSVLYLDIDLETSLCRINERRSETNTLSDIHEAHTEYLGSCLRTGRAAADRLGWQRVSCLENGAARAVEDIHEEIYSHVRRLLQ